MTFSKNCLVAGLFLVGCQAHPPAQPVRVTEKPEPQQVLVRKDAPVKLTASDGTGLSLEKLESKAAVNGPLAFTELHLTFSNPENRVLEGRFEITLPEGAALSRLAMLNANGWQEGEVVEKQRARRVYEDFLHVRQDPALLEQAAGNHFQARIFPIPARGTKEIILSYSQELASDQAYELPLAGLSRVHELNVSAKVWQGPDRPPRDETLKLRDEAPKADFLVQRQVPVQGLVKDDLVMVSVKPQLATDPVAIDNLLVLVDTSASATPGYAEHMAQLKSLLARLGQQYPSARVRLAAFDQNVVPLGDAPLEQAERLVEGLEKRTPLGASHWNGALHWARQQRGFTRVLMVGDGVITAGHERLSDFLPKLQKAGIERIDLLAVGGIRNQETLRPLADQMQGLVLDGDQPLDMTVQALTHKALSGVRVDVAGADWVWPDTLNGLRPGQERLVFAQVPQVGDSVAVTLSGTVSDYRQVPLTKVAWPLLERAAAGARIARLTRECHDCRDEQEKNALRRHIVELSTRFRVVSDFTALLVLETDWDYARFNLRRTALADILVMGAEGVEVKSRPPMAVARPWIRRELPGWRQRGSDVLPTYSRGPVETKTEPSRAAAVPDSGSAFADLGEPAPLAEATRRPAPNFPTYDAEQGLLDHGPDPAPRRSAQPKDDNAMESYLLGRRKRPADRYQQALSGELAQIERLIASGGDARQRALDWLRKEPGNVLALVGYGRALEAAGDKEEAARAYGSIIDLYPGRAYMRRYAGCCLEALGPNGQELAADTFTKAMISRPDHPSSHRLVAYAELRLGHYQKAFERLERGLRRSYPWGRFEGYQEVLRQDLAILGAAWAAQEPSQRDHIRSVLARHGLAIAERPSTRFVLTWETDSSNVDMQLRDPEGQPLSGGAFFNNVTNGYGPECLALPGQAAFPYRMSVRYSARGPMGYGMGKVEVMEFDGRGGLRFVQKPYLVMNDRAEVDLGQLSRPL